MYSSQGSRKWRGESEPELDSPVQANQACEAADGICPDMELAEGLAPLDVIKRAKSGVAHVVQRDSFEFAAEHRTAMFMMNSPDSYFKDPLATIFSEPVSELSVFRAKFKAHERKHELLKRLNDFVLSLPKSRGVLLSAMSVADELYTNGSKNAWDHGQTPYADEPSREGTIEFFAAANETRLVLGCRDSFGRLEIDMLLSRISSCLEKGVASSIQKDTWGAGIGTFYIFDAAKSLYVGVNPGVESVVCASLYMGKRQKDSDSISKNLHLIDLGRS